MNIRHFLTGAVAVVTLCGLTSGLSPSQAIGASSTQTPSVGIWYSTWYQKLPSVDGIWLTNLGANTENQFLADVNGDGLDDAVVFKKDTGAWTVALSTGTSLTAPTQWVTGHGSGSTQQFLADVNGDGLADAIVYFEGAVTGHGGEWYVALSTGSKFDTFSRWADGAGVGAAARQVADVTGDGKADIAVMATSDGYSGTWYVSVSTGSSFGAAVNWGNFGGSALSGITFLFGDLNKDGKADAVYFDRALGSVWQMLSTGTSFNGGTSNPVTGFAAGSTRQWVTDGNGDGYADVYAWSSSGNGTLSAVEYNRAFDKLKDRSTLRTGYADANTKILFGKVIADKYHWSSIVSLMPANGGSWFVQRYATGTTNVNTWANFGAGGAMNQVPMRTNNTAYTNNFAQYDSGDPEVIKEHLALFDKAEIDWLLMDETNSLNVDHGEILNRARDVASALAVHNQTSSHTLRYAFAIGGIQFSGDPADIEAEAKQTWLEFANDPVIGGDNYYRVDGKPLLVVFCTGAQFQSWLNYSGKNWSNHFTVRQSAGSNGTGFYGWQLPATGTTGTSEAMGVMPGWNNHVDPNVYVPVRRNDGLYYMLNCWRPILDLSAKPAQVVINSFNEFAEDTAIEPADTSAYQANRNYAQGYTLREPWYNTDGQLAPTMYWDMTVDYIHQLKHPDLASYSKTSFSGTQGANDWTYEEWVGTTTTPMTWDGSQWNGTQQWAIVTATTQHPAAAADTARVWTAPRAGAVTVSGFAKRQTAQGNGTGVRIMLNNTQLWPATGGQKVLTDTSYKTFLQTLTVAPGDRIAFVVNAVNDTSYDTVTWDATVTYA